MYDCFGSRGVFVFDGLSFPVFVGLLQYSSMLFLVFCDFAGGGMIWRWCWF